MSWSGFIPDILAFINAAATYYLYRKQFRR